MWRLVVWTNLFLLGHTAFSLPLWDHSSMCLNLLSLPLPLPPYQLSVSSATINLLSLKPSSPNLHLFNFNATTSRSSFLFHPLVLTFLFFPSLFLTASFLPFFSSVFQLRLKPFCQFSFFFVSFSLSFPSFPFSYFF